MLEHMKERIAGKIGNANDNAFKLRKLFKMYDTDRSGQVNIEDFRVITESFGMQLDDDSLLALFSKYDKDGKGSLEYEPLMALLLDKDYYPLYMDNMGSTQTKAAAEEAAAIQERLKTICRPKACKLEQVFDAFNSSEDGVLDAAQLFAGCAACGLLLSDREKSEVLKTVEFNNHGSILFISFLKAYC
eukprot:jgi/Botrbrau1/18651/Bobra.0367s0087.1